MFIFYLFYHKKLIIAEFNAKWLFLFSYCLLFVAIVFSLFAFYIHGMDDTKWKMYTFSAQSLWFVAICIFTKYPVYAAAPKIIHMPPDITCTTAQQHATIMYMQYAYTVINDNDNPITAYRNLIRSNNALFHFRSNSNVTNEISSYTYI